MQICTPNFCQSPEFLLYLYKPERILRAMNINTHTHLFTLRNVLSREAVRAIGNRLRHKKVPEYLVEGIENFIFDLSNKPRHLTEDQLLEELVRAVLTTDIFKNFSQNHLHQIPALNAININSCLLYTSPSPRD